MYSLANVSSAGGRARCGCGQTDASPSLPLEKQVKRHTFLKAIRPPLSPAYFTTLWDTEETTTSIWGLAKCAGRHSYVLTYSPTALRQVTLDPFYRCGNFDSVLATRP